MHSFALLSAAAALLACAYAAPTASPTISCDYASQRNPAQLTAGDYIYGSGGVKLGYKSFTDEAGKEELRVLTVDENDATIRALDGVVRVQCNSTALNYFSAPGVFGSDTPVKLVSGVGRHGIPYCVGIKDPNTHPTDIILTPCSQSDTEESQSNQFWLEQWKYNNLYVLNGKSNTTALGSSSSSQGIKWPILQSSADSKPQSYSATPYDADSTGGEGKYNSFYL